jgi:hypothetical protein
VPLVGDLRIFGGGKRNRAVFIRAVWPIAAGDQVCIMAVAPTGLAHDDIKDILSIPEIIDGGSQLREFLFNAHVSTRS